MSRNIINIFAIAVALIIPGAATGQKGLVLTLRADYEQTKTVLHNEPVIFTVSIVNKTAQSDNLWNSAADRRIRQLDELVRQGKMKQEDAGKEKQEIEKSKRSTPAITIGSSASPWTSQLTWTVKNLQSNAVIQLPLKLMTNPAGDAVITLDGSRTVTAYFGISPEEMMNLAAGNYEVGAAIGNNADKALLNVQRESVAAPAMTEAQLYKWGLYYWHAGDAVKTINYADQIFKKNAVSVDGWSLKGDAEVMKGEYKAALESYNEAVKQYYRQQGTGAEPPEYLFSMIGMVKEKLGEVKN